MITVIVLICLSSCAVPENPSQVPFTAKDKAAFGNIVMFPAKLNAEAWQGIDATDAGLASKIPDHNIFLTPCRT